MPIMSYYHRIEKQRYESKYIPNDLTNLVYKHYPAYPGIRNRRIIHIDPSKGESLHLNRSTATYSRFTPIHLNNISIYDNTEAVQLADFTTKRELALYLKELNKELESKYRKQVDNLTRQLNAIKAIRQQEPRVIEINISKDLLQSCQDTKRTKGHSKRLWKKARNFTKLAIFYFVSLQIGRTHSKKIKSIRKSTQRLSYDLAYIADWLNKAQKSFFESLFQSESHDLTKFLNNPNDARHKKIIDLLNLFIANLLDTIQSPPEQIKEIVKHYTSKETYLPESFLTAFELNRLDFTWQSKLKETKDHTQRLLMLVAFLFLSKGYINKGFTLPKGFSKAGLKKNLKRNLILVASLLNAVLIRVFTNSPKPLCDMISLVNYYNGYSMYKRGIEYNPFEGNAFVAAVHPDFPQGDTTLGNGLLSEEALIPFIAFNSRAIEDAKRNVLAWVESLVVPIVYNPKNFQGNIDINKRRSRRYI